MNSNNKKVVYSQMWLKDQCGRVIEVDGTLRAEVSVGENQWRRASTQQANGLLRNALHVRLLKSGAPVVALDGKYLVHGLFERALEGDFEVSIGHGHPNLITSKMLPYAIACSEGIPPFKKGLSVVAYVDERWFECTWVGFEDGLHCVVLQDGQTKYSNRARPWWKNGSIHPLLADYDTTI